MYIMHRPSNIMQLRAHLPTLLQLPLQPTKNMIERQPALPRRSDAPSLEDLTPDILAPAYAHVDNALECKAETLCGVFIKRLWVERGHRGRALGGDSL
jgi:hypothetical protein